MEDLGESFSRHAFFFEASCVPLFCLSLVVVSEVHTCRCRKGFGTLGTIPPHASVMFLKQKCLTSVRSHFIKAAVIRFP